MRESEKVDILPFQTITKEDPTLAKGQTKVEVDGKNGQKVTKVREFYTIAKDGRETIVRSEILSTQEIKAIDQVVLIGTKEVQPDKPQPKPIETAKGDQTDGGSANVEPALPEFPVDQVPVEIAKGDQTDGGSANVEPALPEFPVDQVPVETAKGDQTDGGSANVEPALPEFPVKPLPETKVVTEELPSPVRYEADDSLDAGQRQEIPGQKGQKTTTTTYTIDDQTGEIVAVVGNPVITDATPTIIKIGTKSQQTEEKAGTRYQGDPSQDLSYIHTATGQPKVTITTYTVNPETGEVTPDTKVTSEGTATVVTKGTKPTIDSEELSPVYQGDDTQEVGTQTEMPGAPKVTTTTYTVDETTGVVTPFETVTNDGKAKIIIKGTKPTTRPEDLPVVYKGDETKEIGSESTTAGTPKVTTTTYTVNKQTDEVTSETKVSDQGTAKVITKGTKPKVETKLVPFTTTYQADADTPYGKQVTETKGENGKEVTMTTYTLNEQAGEVTANTPTTEKTPATNAVIKVGNVDKKVSPIAITETEIEDSALEKGKTEVRDAGEEGESTTTTTYTVNSQTGALNNPQTVTITTKEMKPKVIAKGTKEVVEKQVDFNDVTARELYRVASDVAWSA